MRKIIFIVLITNLILSCAKTQPASKPAAPASENQANGELPSAAAELSFLFTRLSGSASNQFAVWVEDAQGNFVKTLYATRWTANGGWKRRPSSIPMWVKKADAASLSKAQIDAVSGATPRTGELAFTWDGTNSLGAAVPDGDFIIILEGTLRWGNLVYYRAPFNLGVGASTPQVSVEYVTLPDETRDAGNDRAMIDNVRVRVFR